MTVKIGPELTSIIQMAYRSNRPLLVSGSTGVGKSESLLQAADTLKIGYIWRDLSLMEAPDLAGIPILPANRNKNERLVYAMPKFLPTDGCGLLVFEELNRSPRHVQVPMLQLCTARMLNDYTLPVGWLPVAAINPAGVEYQGASEMDKALLARFMKINVEPDVKTWLTWAEGKGVHPAVMTFIQRTSKIFEAPDSNPRSWKYVDDVLKESQKNTYSKENFLCAIAGFVGDELAVSFVKYLDDFNQRRKHLPEMSELLEQYTKYRSQVKEAAKRGDSGVLDSLCTSILLHLQGVSSREKIEAKPKLLAALRQLRDDLPAPYRTKITKHASWIGEAAS
jgi:MoxR-like ATPase